MRARAILRLICRLSHLCNSSSSHPPALQSNSCCHHLSVNNALLQPTPAHASVLQLRHPAPSVSIACRLQRIHTPSRQGLLRRLVDHSSLHQPALRLHFVRSCIDACRASCGISSRKSKITVCVQAVAQLATRLCCRHCLCRRRWRCTRCTSCPRLKDCRFDVGCCCSCGLRAPSRNCSTHETRISPCSCLHCEPQAVCIGCSACKARVRTRR